MPTDKYTLKQTFSKKSTCLLLKFSNIKKLFTDDFSKKYTKIIAGNVYYTTKSPDIIIKSNEIASCFV